ncbi:hypothetical protein MMC27_008672 [Xylographa pallens]|nr:hypothetical protein [Xylographa pallens]
MSGASEPTLIACPLNTNVSYDCQNPYPNCTTSYFGFDILYAVGQEIYNACPTDWRIVNQQPEAISGQACKQIAGNSWTYYSAADIWGRLTTWKFPLLQLVAIFPKPPLSSKVEAFVICRLLGNPVGTLRGLLLKLATCQDRAEFWKHTLEGSQFRRLVEDSRARSRYTNVTRKWKALAIITDSYDEWGQDKGDAARDFLLERLTSPDVLDQEKIELLDICQKTGNALAADRTTKSLPVIVAQCFFIGTVGIAFGRTESAAETINPTTYINIEAHSIAFTTLYFWIIPAVFLASIIGVSQTENAIPRILQRFRTDIFHAFQDWETALPNDHLPVEDGEGRPADELRQRSGGIYSFQPNTISPPVPPAEPLDTGYVPQLRSPNLFKRVWDSLVRLVTLRKGSPVFPLVIVAAGTVTGCLISYLVPPVGFDCRNIGEILIYEAWLVSAVFDYIPWGEHHLQRFRFTFTKDALVTVATMGGIIVTQVGIFHRCDCYTNWGKTVVALPGLVYVEGILVHRISTVYPAIAFLCIGLELVVFPALILAQYSEAIRVFMQRDDNASNMQVWHSVLDGWERKDWSCWRMGWRKIWVGTKDAVRPGLGRMRTNSYSVGLLQRISTSREDDP